MQCDNVRVCWEFIYIGYMHVHIYIYTCTYSLGLLTLVKKMQSATFIHRYFGLIYLFIQSFFLITIFVIWPKSHGSGVCPRNTGKKVEIHPEKDASPSQSIMHTLIHTLIHILGQFSIASTPYGMFLWGENPHRHRDNISNISNREKKENNCQKI